MGNDDEIKKPEIVETSLVEAKKLFLGSEVEPLRKEFEQKEAYYLEKELFKLKKNKSQLVWYLVLSFVIVFFLIGFFGVKIIQIQEGDIEIGIEDFASINLSEIIQKVDNYKVNLKNINNQLEKRNKELEAKILLIEKTKKIELSILQKKKLSRSLYRKESLKIEKRASREKGIAKKQYEKKIVPLHLERDQIKEKILVIEKENKVENAIQKDSVSENIKQLTEIRLNKIRDDYEKLLDDKKRAHENEKNVLKKRFSKLMTDVQEKYEKQISDYQNGFERYVDETGNVGIVLNVESDKTTQLYIHPLYEVKKNTKAYVIDRKSKIKAEITINKKDDYFEGKVNKLLNRENKIAPLDSVVLILK